MSWWDIIFVKTIKNLGMILELYKRYVDDELIACPPINPGWNFNTDNQKMEYDEVLAREDRDEPALRTAKVLQSIANTLESCIQVTFDTPESNSYREMPVLDLEVWVDSNEVKHTLYKKPVSSYYTI